MARRRKRKISVTDAAPFGAPIAASAAASRSDKDAPPKRQKRPAAASAEVPDPTPRKQRVGVRADLRSRSPQKSRSASMIDSHAGAEKEEKEGEEGEEETPPSASKQLQDEAMQRASRLAESEGRSEVSWEPEPSPEPASDDEAPDAVPAQEAKPEGARATEGAAPPTAAPNRGRHVVFDDDDDVDRFVAAAAARADEERARKPSAAPAGGEHSEDDDAPEAVSAQAAVESRRKADEALAEAAERQARKVKKKRQERDAFLKQQADGRKRRATRSDAGAEHAAGKEAVNAAGAGGQKEPETGTLTGGEVVSARRRTERPGLPDTLPAEFLTDSEAEGEDEMAAEVARPRPTRITFEDAVQALDTGPARPRDRVVGSTVYRVLNDQADPNLAPKARRRSQKLRNRLLQRSRIGLVPGRNGSFSRKN